MKATKFLALAAAAFVFTACNNEEGPAIDTGEPVALKIIGNIGSVQSRAHDNMWDDSDMIGVTAVSTGKTNYANMKYAHQGGGIFAYSRGEQFGIFFQDTQEVNISAYYPFSGEDGTAPGMITVETDDQTEQSSFDYLYAAATPAVRNSPVSLRFEHKMSRLIFKITTDTENGFTAEDVKKAMLFISHIALYGTFNTATGDAQTDGRLLPNWEINAIPTDEGNVRTYSMIVFPQQITRQTLKAVIDGTGYSCPFNLTLEAGKSYTYNITVKKTGLSISSCNIENWTEVAGGSGIAEMI